jgi:hypothetical protein
MMEQQCWQSKAKKPSDKHVTSNIHDEKQLFHYLWVACRIVFGEDEM